MTERSTFDDTASIEPAQEGMRMSTLQILEMGNKSVGDENKKLLNRARIMENSSPQPRHAIHLWDLLLAMKEKERLGINFNRSVTLSLESRWEVVNKLTVEFLEEVISLNDQLSEEAMKQSKQLLNLILTRIQRLGMASRIEQMAGLLMHITFYRTLLKAKLGEMQETTSFLVSCSDLLGFSHPNQIMDRYSALKFMLSEISEDYEQRIGVLNKMQDSHTDIKEKAMKENLVLRNRMALLHVRLKELQKGISEMERFIDEKEQQAVESEVKLRNIKCSITHCYSLLMTYKGLDCNETDPIAQIHEVGFRLPNLIAAVKIVEEQLLRSTLTESTTAKGRTSKDTTAGSVQENQGDQADSSSGDDKTHDDDDDGGGGRDRGGGRGKSRRGRGRGEKFSHEGNKSMNRLSLQEERNGQEKSLIVHAREKKARQEKCVGAPAKARSFDRGVATGSSLACERAGKPQELTERAEPQIKQPPGKFPFLSTDSCAFRRHTEAIRVGRSLTLAHGEAFTRERGGLDTIHEIGNTATKKLKSTSCDHISNRLSEKRRATTNSSLKCGNTDSTSMLKYKRAQRGSGLPSPTIRSMLSISSLDRSSNKSTSERMRSLSQTFTSNDRIKERIMSLPNIPSNHSGLVRRVTCAQSESFCGASPAALESKSSLCSLSRMSERIRNQIHNVERFYYLSTAPVQTTNLSSCSCVWDDGVYLGSLYHAQKESSRIQAKSSTRLAMTTKKREKNTKSDTKPIKCQPVSKVEDKCAKTMKAPSPRILSLKVALKRLSPSADKDLMKNVDFLQQTFSNEGGLKTSTFLPPNSTRTCATLQKPVSTAALNGGDHTKPLKTGRTFRSGYKRICGGPSLIKKTSPPKGVSGKGSTVRGKSYRPPLRRPSLLQQRWRHAGSSSNTAPPAVSESPCSGSVRGNAPCPESIPSALAKLRRCYPAAQNFKRDCLAILASVKLGSRWPEDQQPKD